MVTGLVFSVCSLLLLPKGVKRSVYAIWFFIRALLCVPALSGQMCYREWFFLSGLNAPLIILTLWVGGLMVIAREQVKSITNVFCKVVSLLCGVLLVVFLVHSFFVFYIAFEAALLPTLYLILSWGYQPERLQAAMYLVLYTVGASLPLLVRILALLG